MRFFCLLNSDQWKSFCALKCSPLIQTGYKKTHIRGWAQPWARSWILSSLACPSGRLMPRPWEGLAKHVAGSGWYLPSGGSKHFCHPVRKQRPFITPIIIGRSSVSLSVSFSCHSCCISYLTVPNITFLRTPCSNLQDVIMALWRCN